MISVHIRIFGTQIKLDGKVVGRKGFVRHRLRGAKSNTDTVFVWGLGVSVRNESCEKSDDENNEVVFFFCSNITIKKNN